MQSQRIRLIQSLILLMFLLVSSLTFADSKLPINHGRNWRSLSIAQKQMFVLGFGAGVSSALWLVERANGAPLTARQAILNEIESELSIRHLDDLTVVEAISTLYEDSANNYLPFSQMVIIAKARIQGEPKEVIERLLQRSRKSAIVEAK